jgi:hypothetical protein
MNIGCFALNTPFAVLETQLANAPAMRQGFEAVLKMLFIS